MFKALHKPDGEEIVILDPRWRRQLDTLRRFDARDELLCQGCLQPVRVRAGDVKRWHFAHKHLQNCPFEFESPVLLQCRAILYEWLVLQLNENVVTLEKSLSLPRPVDCWVSGPAGEAGYWIIENRMPPVERQSLAAGLAGICPHPIWVFTASMLHTEDDNPERPYLTTTEREFMRSTGYDAVVQSVYGLPGASLHYLDSDQEKMITLRGLQVFHRPQLYSGYRYENPLSQVSRDPVDGGFIHPGEAEQLGRFRTAIRSREYERQKTEQRINLKMAELLGDLHTRPAPPARSSVEYQNQLDGAGEAGLPKCIYCGQATDDYWYLSRADNTCKCRNCYREGRY
jgi:Competence protein CoiA-like family